MAAMADASPGTYARGGVPSNVAGDDSSQPPSSPSHQHAHRPSSSLPAGVPLQMPLPLPRVEETPLPLGGTPIARLLATADPAAEGTRVLPPPAAASAEVALAERRRVIPLSQLTFERVVGEGSFGRIYKAVWRRRTVAVKALFDQTMFSEEAQLLSMLSHRNVVRYLGECPAPRQACSESTAASGVAATKRKPGISTGVYFDEEEEAADDSVGGGAESTAEPGRPFGRSPRSHSFRHRRNNASNSNMLHHNHNNQHHHNNHNHQHQHHPHLKPRLGPADLPRCAGMLVTEYCPGGTLHDRIYAEGPIKLDDAVSWMLDVIAGLAYLHYEGPVRILHLDLKPLNVLLTSRGTCKLADLGTAMRGIRRGNNNFIEPAGMDEAEAPGTAGSEGVEGLGTAAATGAAVAADSALETVTLIESRENGAVITTTVLPRRPSMDVLVAQRQHDAPGPDLLGTSVSSMATSLDTPNTPAGSTPLSALPLDSLENSTNSGEPAFYNGNIGNNYGNSCNSGNSGNSGACTTTTSSTAEPSVDMDSVPPTTASSSTIISPNVELANDMDSPRSGRRTNGHSSATLSPSTSCSFDDNATTTSSLCRSRSQLSVVTNAGGRGDMPSPVSSEQPAKGSTAAVTAALVAAAARASGGEPTRTTTKTTSTKTPETTGESLSPQLLLSGVLSPETKLATRRVHGTVRYMAPELIRGESVTDRCDVWSFGVLCTEILSRNLPYKEMSNNLTVTYKLGATNCPPELPEGVPQQLRQVIESCFWPHFADRPPSITLRHVLEEVFATIPGHASHDSCGAGLSAFKLGPAVDASGERWSGSSPLYMSPSFRSGTAGGKSEDSAPSGSETAGEDEESSPMTTASSRGSGEIPSRLHYSTGGAGMSSPTASASKRPEMGSRQHLQVPPATPGRSASDAADYHSSSTSQRDDESSTAETVAAPITQAELLKEAVRLRDWEQRLETREQVLHAAEAQLHVDQQMLETRIQELAQQAPDEGVDMQGGGTASGGHTSVTSPGEGSPPARESYAAMVKVQPTTGSGGGGGGDGGISGAEGDRDHGV